MGKRPSDICKPGNSRLACQLGRLEQGFGQGAQHTTHHTTHTTRFLFCSIVTTSLWGAQRAGPSCRRKSNATVAVPAQLHAAGNDDRSWLRHERLSIAMVSLNSFTTVPTGWSGTQRHGDRRPEPERERSARSTTPFGERRDCFRGRGHQSCWTLSGRCVQPRSVTWLSRLPSSHGGAWVVATPWTQRLCSSS